MKKEDMFETELNYIKSERLRKSAKKIINSLPDYFFVIPASSTGKYHPKYTLGKGGLVRHTKVAVKIAYELLITNTFGGEFSDNEKDLIVIALLIHDGLKLGEIPEKYTVFEHPLLIAQKIKEEYRDFGLTNEEANLLASMLESHMGEWTRNKRGQEILPKPETKYQKFVHMCDYLASRKFINVEFKGNEIVD
ncbi:MAG: HD domain-containing protein [Mollicutes bacterium]|nr:HD domain-containing protein [Mollicutes bacterium]